jgi:hypothetical protein
MVESIERDGGHFLRKVQRRRTDIIEDPTSSSHYWIQVSPMLAQMYTLYRLKQKNQFEMIQEG